MKIFNYASWVAGALGVVLMILGCIALLLKTSILGVNHAVNFFHLANSLLLVCIACMIYIRVNQKPGK